MALEVGSKKHVIVFTDPDENTAKMTMYTISGQAGTIGALLRAVTNCAIERASTLTIMTNVGDSPDSGFWTAGVYDSVSDKALLIFQDTLGNHHKFMLPGPDDADFEADQKTVNRLQADIAALIQHMLANIITIAGTALAEYVRGYRIKGTARSIKPGVVSQV